MKEFNFNFQASKNYKKKLVYFLKSLSNVEIGGARLYDGLGNNYIQNPYEIAELIFFLKSYEKKNHLKLSNFLEIGFASGINNTILNKFFNFKKNVAIDIVQPTGINYGTFYANLRFKKLVLLCGNSTSPEILKSTKILGNYDIIFIDGGHEYKTVKSDFINYSKLLNKNGLIILHDIKSNVVKGVQKFWRELKKNHKSKFKFNEIFNGGNKMNCGLGILNKKNGK